MKKLLPIIAVLFCLNLSAQVKVEKKPKVEPQIEKVDSLKIPIISIELINNYLSSIVDKQGVSHLDYLKIQAALQTIVNEALKPKQVVEATTNK